MKTQRIPEILASALEDHGDTISFKLLASLESRDPFESYRKRRIFDSRPPRRRIIESSESAFVSRYEFPEKSAVAR